MVNVYTAYTSKIYSTLNKQTIYW